MSLIYDLHSHSTASDGTLSPGELATLAARKGVDVLALTDHDTTNGIGLAMERASESGLGIVPGVEISVTWKKRTVHILGLNIDPDNAELQQGLTELSNFRVWRAEEIARRLEKSGIPGALEGARAYSKGTIIGRTHFAHFLVERNYAKDIRDVFKKYLVTNKPGHVSGQWAELQQVVSWIRNAGGQALIAHPARYNLSATKLRQLITEFVDCGGAGLEVVSGSHNRNEAHAMADYAQRYELYASCGSDYHGPENTWVQLGKLPSFPGDCIPIWESEGWKHPHATKKEKKVITR